MERAVRGERIIIPFEERGKARSFQMRFGAFRRALQRCSIDAHKDLAVASYGVQIRIEGDNVVLGPVLCEDEVTAVLRQLS